MFFRLTRIDVANVDTKLQAHRRAIKFFRHFNQL